MFFPGIIPDRQGREIFALPAFAVLRAAVALRLKSLWGERFILYCSSVEDCGIISLIKKQEFD